MILYISRLFVFLGINGLVQYFILDGDLKNQFRIDSGDGRIYSTSLLDRELTPVYNLIVMATDMADSLDERHSSTAEVSITYSSCTQKAKVT